MQPREGEGEGIGSTGPWHAGKTSEKCLAISAPGRERSCKASSIVKQITKRK